MVSQRLKNKEAFKRQLELEKHRQALNKLGYGAGATTTTATATRGIVPSRVSDSSASESLLLEVQRLRNKNKELEQANLRLRNTVSVSEEAVKSYRRKISKILAGSEGAKEQVSRLKSRNSQLSKELESMRRKMGEYVADIGSLHARNEALLSRLEYDTDDDTAPDSGSDFEVAGAAAETDPVPFEIDTVRLLDIDPDRLTLGEVRRLGRKLSSTSLKSLGSLKSIDEIDTDKLLGLN